MQDFDFPKAGLMFGSPHTILLIPIVMIVCAIVGYFLRPEWLMHWIKLGFVGVLFVFMISINHTKGFDHLQISPEAEVKIWIDSREGKVLSIQKDDIEFVHYGFGKQGASSCYIYIKLKDGTSYQSSYEDKEPCFDAYQALTQVTNTH